MVAVTSATSLRQKTTITLQIIDRITMLDMLLTGGATTTKWLHIKVFLGFRIPLCLLSFIIQKNDNMHNMLLVLLLPRNSTDKCHMLG